jgi:capsular exopolysaccharide synthesis family protein
MSRVADAQARAAGRDGHGAVASPERHPGAMPESIDSFPSEQRASGVPDVPGSFLEPLPQPGTGTWSKSEGNRRRSNGDQATGPLAVFRGFRKDVVEKLTIENGATGAMVEEYRKLAATLHHAQGVHGLKTVMVSSAAAGEGKTLTSVNLALTLSESYRRQVLLIDCDLRKPSIHEIFQVQNTAGLIDVLTHGPDKKVPLVEVSSHLKLLLSGGISPDPMSLLSSQTVHHLLKDAVEVFDWVIVDTPPAAFLPDCNLLASAVDAAVLVVRAFDTPYPLTQRAVEAIGREKILGVVMNRAERPVTTKYYYGYYNYV